MKKIIRNFILFFVLGFCIAEVLIGQTYQVGDYINDDFESPICANGEGYWSYNADGRTNVVWINLFTSW